MPGQECFVFYGVMETFPEFEDLGGRDFQLPIKDYVETPFMLPIAVAVLADRNLTTFALFILPSGLEIFTPALGRPLGTTSEDC